MTQDRALDASDIVAYGDDAQIRELAHDEIGDTVEEMPDVERLVQHLTECRENPSIMGGTV